MGDKSLKNKEKIAKKQAKAKEKAVKKSSKAIDDQPMYKNLLKVR